MVADREVEFCIGDEDGTVLKKGKGKDLAIWHSLDRMRHPKSSAGTYEVKLKDDDNEFLSDQTEFKVSRYELPTFIVNTATDHDYYLPDQTVAEATISAAYLSDGQSPRVTLKSFRKQPVSGTPLNVSGTNKKRSFMKAWLLAKRRYTVKIGFEPGPFVVAVRYRQQQV